MSQLWQYHWVFQLICDLGAGVEPTLSKLNSPKKYHKISRGLEDFSRVIAEGMDFITEVCSPSFTNDESFCSLLTFDVIVIMVVVMVIMVMVMVI